MATTDEHRIETAETLRELIGTPGDLASRKVMTRIDVHARDFIARSPFLCLSSADASGRADVTPRGDPPGFVRVLDETTIAIPDRPGNNRLDTMSNILANPNVGVLFFVPGFEDMLRINGRAWLSRDPAILSVAAVNGKTPKLAICVRVDELFFHCAKALKRSHLWDPTSRLDRRSMPSLAQIILEQTAGGAKVAENELAKADARLEESYRTRLY
ncbi:MAG: pyridoxamine 5'-phosphate oxidase family protein [Parvibaculaceae bacterium]